MTTTEKISFLENQKDIIENKKSKFIFYSPNTQGQPTASINEIYRHGKVLQDYGFEVIIVHDYTEEGEDGGDLTGDGVEPFWIEDDLKGLKHANIRVEEEIQEIKISVSDFLIIPEAATFLMEDTVKKKFPCEKIVFLQSVDVGLNSLVVGAEYKDWGITNIITSSEECRKYVENTFAKNTYDVKVTNPAIPDLFSVPDSPKKLTIGVYSKNYNDLNNKVIKPFYLKYKHLNFVHFKPLANLKREDFAEELGKCAFSVWIDRISGFGTFPIESMASGTIPICMMTDLRHEYIKTGKDDFNAVWNTNINQMADSIATALEMFVQREIPEGLYVRMQKTASDYRRSKQDPKIPSVYEHFVEKRIKTLELAIEQEKKTLEAEEQQEVSQ